MEILHEGVADAEHSHDLGNFVGNPLFVTVAHCLCCHRVADLAQSGLHPAPY